MVRWAHFMCSFHLIGVHEHSQDKNIIWEGTCMFYEIRESLDNSMNLLNTRIVSSSQLPSSITNGPFRMGYRLKLLLGKGTTTTSKSGCGNGPTVRSLFCVQTTKQRLASQQSLRLTGWATHALKNPQNEPTNIRFKILSVSTTHIHTGTKTQSVVESRFGNSLAVDWKREVGGHYWFTYDRTLML